MSGGQFGESSGWGRVEFAYYLMAIDCQIQMSQSQLLEENERAHFRTSRFDGEGNVKHHIQTLCDLLNYDFNDMNGYSYEQVFQTMRLSRLTNPENEQLYPRIGFNVMATNYVDNTKNFSFILKKDEQWRLAPANEVYFSFDPGNHWVNRQTFSLNGKRLYVTKEDLMTIARDNNIIRGQKIIKDINSTVSS